MADADVVRYTPCVFMEVKTKVLPDPDIVAKCAVLFSAHPCFYNPAASGPPRALRQAYQTRNHHHGGTTSSGSKKGHRGEFRRAASSAVPPPVPAVRPKLFQASPAQKVQAILNKISDMNYKKLTSQCEELIKKGHSNASEVVKQIYEHAHKQGSYHNHYIFMIMNIGLPAEEIATLAEEFIKECVTALKESFLSEEESSHTEDYDAFCERMKLKLHITGRMHMLRYMMVELPLLSWSMLIEELQSMWVSLSSGVLNIYGEMFLDTMTFLYSTPIARGLVKRMATDVLNITPPPASMRIIFKAKDLLGY